LHQKAYHILETVNVLKWKSKEPLPMFMLTDRTENIPKIYEISNIRDMRVEVTPYRKTNARTARVGGTQNHTATNNRGVSNATVSTPQKAVANPKKYRQNATIVGKTTQTIIGDVL
jgi:hypothetical protein